MKKINDTAKTKKMNKLKESSIKKLKETKKAKIEIFDATPIKDPRKISTFAPKKFKKRYKNDPLSQRIDLKKNTAHDNQIALKKLD